MTIPETLELTRITLSLIALAASSYHDYKTRRVPDTIPKILIPTATTLTLADILLQPNPQTKLLTYAAYTAITATIFYAIAYTGLFGGADAKIMIALSLATPWQPTTIKPTLGITFPILPISILNNSLLLAVTSLPYAAASNLAWKNRTGQNLFNNLEKEPIHKKIAALLFCVKKEKAKVKPYDLIAEKQGKLTLFNKIQEEDLTPQELQNLPENVFVTFSLPLVIFITAGYATTILIGDLPLFLVKNILKL